MYQGLSHFANPLAIYEQQLSQEDQAAFLCAPRSTAVFLECVRICAAASCVCVYLSTGICKLMVTTNGSSSCAMNVSPPRKLLKELVKYAFINRVMHLIRKVGQATEFHTHNY